jgi:hypothetical protein
MYRQLKHARSVPREYVEKAARTIVVTVVTYGTTVDTEKYEAAASALRAEFLAQPRTAADVVICGVPWSQQLCNAVTAATVPVTDVSRKALSSDHGVLFRLQLSRLQGLASPGTAEGGAAVLPRDALIQLVSLLVGQRCVDLITGSTKGRGVQGDTFVH